MATAASRPRKLFRLGLSPEKGNEILGFLLAALVIFLAASLVSYHPDDPSVLRHPGWGEAATHNWIGPVGAQIAALFFALFGVASFGVPMVLAGLTWKRFSPTEASEPWERSLGLAAVFVSLPGLCQLLVGEMTWRGASVEAGGVVGALLDRFLVARLNFGGTLLALSTVFLVGVSLAARSTLGDLLVVWRERLAAVWEPLRVRLVRRRKRQHDGHAQRRALTEPVPRNDAPRRASPRPSTPSSQELGLPNRVIARKGTGHFAFRKVQVEAPRAAPESPRRASRPVAPAASDGATVAEGGMAPRRQEQIEVPPLPELPPVNLLRTEAAGSRHAEADLLRQGELIRASCSEFGVEGTVEGILPGPVVTVFELQPAPGVKVSRIVNLQDDLALTLKAESVRIDRIPGHSTLGIEVPNRERSMIHLGHLLAQDAFRQAPSVLTMAIGTDIHGRPYYADLATMPHLLVAGATGAGKSVGLQGMITSILFKATREEVQFIFIDPKRIELGVYADVPHLKTEVVVEPKKAANALRWAVAEMERRYRLLAEVHVRSIAYYNRAVRDPKERRRLALKEGESEFRAEDLKPLPYYVIIIDELADLMLVASGEVESSIARLAQMARAVGIHLIVATQRPSVDVLTGTIKANFPCRLSFATASRHDSRTILDQVGAEKLLGKGDALFVPPGTSRVQRLHGAYISEGETAALIRWLKRRGKPEIDLEVLKDPEEPAATGGAAGEDDPLFDEAARLVVRERQASASFLQRRMRIGFSRAARLVDMLEADGLLGPAQGSKPREVLVPVDYFDEIDGEIEARVEEP